MDIFSALLDRQTYACETIRVNRGDFAQWFKTENLNAGDATYIRNDDILAVHWTDKSNAFVLSSFHANLLKGNLVCCEARLYFRVQSAYGRRC